MAEADRRDTNSSAVAGGGCRQLTGEEGDAWMAPVGEQMVPLNCPPGLEYLTMIDQLIVKQKLYKQ